MLRPLFHFVGYFFISRARLYTMCVIVNTGFFNLLVSLQGITQFVAKRKSIVFLLTVSAYIVRI